MVYLYYRLKYALTTAIDHEEDVGVVIKLIYYSESENPRAANEFFITLGSFFSLGRTGKVGMGSGTVFWLRSFALMLLLPLRFTLLARLFRLLFVCLFGFFAESFNFCPFPSGFARRSTRLVPLIRPGLWLSLLYTAFPFVCESLSESFTTVLLLSKDSWDILLRR